MLGTTYIRRKDGGELGTLGEVQADISNCLPGVNFWRDPSGAEKAKRLPEVHREMFAALFGYLLADMLGLYEYNDLSFEFFLGSKDTGDEVTVEIRGDGNPLAVLRQVAINSDWQVYGPAGDSMDLDQHAVPGWEDFVQDRDSATDVIRQRRDADGVRRARMSGSVGEPSTASRQSGRDGVPRWSRGGVRSNGPDLHVFVELQCRSPH